MAQNKIQPQTIKEFAEDTALKLFLPAGLVAAAAGYLYNFNYHSLPVLGLHSIGFPIIVAAVVLTFAAFVYGYLQSLAFEKKTTIRKILNAKTYFYTFALSLTHALLAGIFTAFIIVLLNYAFKGLLLDRFSSAFILGLSAAVIVYLITTLAMSITIESITAVVLGFLLVGVLGSMLATDNPNWWQINFSYLGTVESGSTRIFNATLVITAAVMLVLVDFLFETVRPAFAKDKRVKMKNFNWVKRLFIISAIALGGVGVFSWSRSPFFHNLSAALLGISFGVMMGGMKQLLPTFSKTFYFNSYLIVGFMVFSWVVLLNGINYINLTAFELLAAVLCGIWVGLFLRSLALKDTSS